MPIAQLRYAKSDREPEEAIAFGEDEKLQGAVFYLRVAIEMR